MYSLNFCIRMFILATVVLKHCSPCYAEISIYPPETELPAPVLKVLKALESWEPRVMCSGSVVLSFEVRSSDGKAFGEKEFQLLAQLTPLQSIGMSVDADSELHYLRPLADLRHLDVHCDKQGGKGLVHLDAFPKLQHLDLDGRGVTDDSLKHLVVLKNLETLGLGGTSAEDLRCLLAMPKLWSLNLHTATDRALSHLNGLHSLQRLYVSSSKISDAGLQHLSGLKLETLDLSGTGITDAGLQYLSTLKELQDLRLSKTRILGDGLKHLSQLKRLESLELRGNKLADDSLKFLGSVHSLKSLDLKDTGITDEAILNLTGLENLTHLSPSTSNSILIPRI